MERELSWGNTCLADVMARVDLESQQRRQVLGAHYGQDNLLGELQ